jgi:hypothetical protein
MRSFFKPMSKDRPTAPSAIESKPAPSHEKLAEALEATEEAMVETDVSWNLEIHKASGAGSSLLKKQKRDDDYVDDDDDDVDDDEDEHDDDDEDDVAVLLPCLFGVRGMLVDTKFSTSTHQALDAPEPGNKNGTAVYSPVLIPKQKPASSAQSVHVFVAGNCPTHTDGRGNNLSKLVLCSKAAGVWHGRHSGVYASVSVIDLSTA